MRMEYSEFTVNWRPLIFISALAFGAVELRVGELEEVEEKNQREIHHLYEQLRHERARATRLEAEGAQHKQDAQDYLERLNKEIAKGNRLEATFQEQLQQHQLEQARKMQEMAKLAKEAGQRSAKDSGIDANGSPTSSNDGKTSGGAEDSLESLGKSVMDAANSSSRNTRNFSPEMAAEYESMVNLLKEKDDALRRAEERLKAEEEKLAKLLREQDGQTREVQLNSQVEKDKMELTIKELKDADSQSLLRLAQFKARFHVQDERITDMEQQLSSLYTAFGLIKEERDVEDMKRAALQCNLNEADEEMARQVEHVEKKRNQSQRNPMQSERGPNEAGSPWRNVSSSNSSAGTPTTAAAGIPQAIQTPRTVVSTPGMASPVATPQRLETPPASVTAQPYVVTPQRTPGTWQLVFPSPDATQTRSFPSTPSTGGKNGLLIKGVLLVKSKSVMRKWKSKFCKLYLQRNHYQWDMEGKSYTLGTGISSVEFDPNYPLSFTVYTNPYDAMAPVIHAAASSEDDYHRWMSALTTATTGRIDDASAFDRTPQQSLEAATPRHSSAESVVSGLSVEEREAADLERALRLSQTMT